MSRICLISLCLVVFFSNSGFAEVPQLINYQGRLTSDSGEPFNGSKTINFKIYNDNESGDSLWSSGDRLIQITDGLFSYELGSAFPIPSSIFSEDRLYLSINLDPEGEISRT